MDESLYQRMLTDLFHQIHLFIKGKFMNNDNWQARGHIFLLVRHEGRLSFRLLGLVYYFDLPIIIANLT